MGGQSIVGPLLRDYGTCTMYMEVLQTNFAYSQPAKTFIIFFVHSMIMIE